MAKFANDTPLSTTLGEWRMLVRRPKFWAVLGGVIIILSLVGPFGTFDALSLPQRLGYWAAVAAASFGIGFFVSMPAAIYAERVGLPDRLALVVGGIAAGVPVAWLNAGAVQLVFGGELLSQFWSILPYAIAICIIVVYLYELQDDPPTQAPPAIPTSRPDERPVASALLRKLPPELGRDIVCLQAQDHYVKVTTPNGSALVLMRFRDAVQDLAGLGGLRVHRSWWVRTSQIDRLVRRNGKWLLRSRLGGEIPVGRAYRKAVREAFG